VDWHLYFLPCAGEESLAVRFDDGAEFVGGVRAAVRDGAGSSGPLQGFTDDVPIYPTHD
jgi:hypothetical protein